MKAGDGARPSLWMLGGAASFAAMGSLTHALGPRCDWLVVSLVRAVFMLASAVALARTAGVRLVLFDPPRLWMRSLAGSFSLVCNFYALTRLPVADAITLANVHPLWIVLLSAWALRRPPTRAEALGVACGLAGVALIQRPHLGGDGFAALVALLSSVSTAVAMLGLHGLRGVDARAVVAHFAGVAAIVSATWLAFRWQVVTPSILEAQTLLMLMGVGVTGTIGQVCLTRAYASGPPARVAVVGLTQVVFAMAIDVIVWGRTLGPAAMLGFGLVLAPTAWFSGAAGRRLAQVVGTRRRG